MSIRKAIATRTEPAWDRTSIQVITLECGHSKVKDARATHAHRCIPCSINTRHGISNRVLRRALGLSIKGGE